MVWWWWWCLDSETHKKTLDETGVPCSSSSLSPTFNNSSIQVDMLFMEKSKRTLSPLNAYSLKDTYYLNRLFSMHPSSIHLSPFSSYFASYPPFLLKAPPFSTPTQSFKGTPGILFPRALLPLFLGHAVYGQHFQIYSPDLQSSL